MTIHLGRALPLASCDLPGALAGGPPNPCLVLLRTGHAQPLPLPGTLVSSYLTVSPLPVTACTAHRRSALCCAIPPVTRPGTFPSVLPYGVRTFLSLRRGHPAHSTISMNALGGSGNPRFCVRNDIFLCGIYPLTGDDSYKESRVRRGADRSWLLSLASRLGSRLRG